MTAKQEKPGKTLKIFRELECNLTAAEVREAAKLLAEAMNQKDGADAKRASFLSQIKADIAALNATIARNQYRVGSEKEVRTVECEVRYFFGRNGGEKEIWRKDTGELVKTEVVTDDERQGSFA